MEEENSNLSVPAAEEEHNYVKFVFKKLDFNDVTQVKSMTDLLKFIYHLFSLSERL